MKVYNLLSTTSPYKKNDRVQGLVYNISHEWGYFVAVDNQYHGLIHNKELYMTPQIGDEIEAKVCRYGRTESLSSVCGSQPIKKLKETPIKYLKGSKPVMAACL